MNDATYKVAILLLTVATALAMDDDCFFTESELVYSMSLLNMWDLNWTPSSDLLTDLDYDEAAGMLSCVSRTPCRFCYFSVSDPSTLLSTLDILGGVDWPHGLASTGSGAGLSTYLNDSNSDGVYYRYQNGSWNCYTGNPATEYGMGLAIDAEGYLWESAYGGHVFRFLPGSGTYQGFTLHITDNYPEGITVFPYEDNIGVAIGYYSNKLVEFYEYIPSYLYYLGTASVPGTFDYCYGLEYISDRGSFYMLVKASNQHQILELDCDVLDLQPDTWGRIKSQF